MTDLRYDTEQMRSSAKEYRETAAELANVRKELKKQIDDLKNTHWKSEAGKAFLEVYEDDWAKGVDRYVAVLNKMSELLDKAARDYDEVTKELNKIDGITA